MEPSDKLAAAALCGVAQLCAAGAAGARSGTVGGGEDGKASYVDMVDGSLRAFN